MDYKAVKNCRVCGSDWLEKYLDLGNLPLANALVDSPQWVEKYPLELLLCKRCHLTQLSIVVEPRILYSNYPYESSVSGVYKDHARNLAKSLKENFTFSNNPPTVLDIAANDGCLLNQFRKEGFCVRGVEPCERLANKCMLEYLIPMQTNFWSDDTARYARAWSGEDVITATNVFAHVDDVHSFLRGVNYHFENNRKGILIIEVPHFLKFIQNNEFDTVYHEHLSYFLLGPLMTVLASHGLRVFKVERIPIHGGSIRVYASQWEYPTESELIREILTEEARLNENDFEAYKELKNYVFTIKTNLYNAVESLVKSGKKVVAYGASAKGCTLLNYCGLDNHLISYCVDETPYKIGKYIPGVNVPIKPFSEFEQDKPDYILLTAWNFKEVMMEKTKHVGAKYILPIPMVEII